MSDTPEVTDYPGKPGPKKGQKIFHPEVELDELGERCRALEWQRPETLSWTEDFKMEKFASLYVSGNPLLVAYLEAGYANTRSARNQAWKLFRDERVQKYIRSLRDKAELEALEVIEVLRQQARNDIADVLDDDGRFNWQLAQERGVTNQIKKLKITEREIIRKDEVIGKEITYEVEMYSAQSAANTLTRVFGMEQLPRANANDEEARRKWWSDRVERLAASRGWERQQALDYITQNIPRAAKYLM